MTIQDTWSAVGRFAAALTLGAAATRIAAPGSDDPTTRYGADVEAYEQASPNVFVDYPTSYPDVEALESAADVVVIARPLERAEGIQHPRNSIVDFAVTRVLKGTVAASHIPINYPAGAGDVIFGDPPFEPDMTYLLFLSGASPGPYNVLAGPQGRFVIVGGDAYALSAMYQDSRIFDTGASFPVDRVAWDLGNAGTGPGVEAVMPPDERQRHQL